MTVTVDVAVDDRADAAPRPLAGRRVLLAGTAPHAAAALSTTLTALGAEVADPGAAGRAPDVALLGERAAAIPTPAGPPRVTIGGPEADLQLPVRAGRLGERLLEALGAPVERRRRRRRARPPQPVRARILVAEDSEVNRMLMLRQLERLGIAADVVDNGREAIRAAADRDYPLILMDLRMPEVDGFDATRAIRAGGRTRADRRGHRQRGAGRPRGLPGGGHGRPPRQAGDARVAAPGDRALAPGRRGPPPAADGPQPAGVPRARDARPARRASSAAARRSRRSSAAGTPSCPAASPRSSRRPRRSTPPSCDASRTRSAARPRSSAGRRSPRRARRSSRRPSGELTAGHAQALVQVVERTCGEARAAMLAWLDAA